MKRRYNPKFMPHPTMPPRPKKEFKKGPPQVEPKEVETLPEELNERPNDADYGFGPVPPGGPYTNPGWGGDMGKTWPLAEARVRWQRYGQVFNPAEALQRGTIFPELYRPYPG
ncbi:spore coat associated protein CotJA [Desulfolucanica intricata]|uniref:spore coat associated protein CotJA n=1 Tax=Desulfolucanica intricata TaxID=1285191 RepID=UPI000834E728|nr:spore coat associated protein CotJA [Desulfolucanica intricata]